MPLSYGAIGALSALPSLATGVGQLLAANNTRLQDTTTPEQREALAMARQRAAAGRFPGQGLASARLRQSQNAALQAATLGSGSGSDLLAAAVAADRIRGQGEAQLAAQGESYNDQAQRELGTQLQLQAQQRQRDLATYNQTKASYLQGGLTNLNNAVQTGAAYAAYGLDKAALPGADLGQEVDPLTPGMGTATTPASQGVPTTLRGVRLPSLPVDPASPLFVGPPVPAPTYGPGTRGFGAGYRPSLNGGRYRLSGLRYGFNR